MKKIIIILFILLLSVSAFAEDIFVDADCTAVTTYNVTADSCTGGSDRVYPTITTALAYMSGGDDIYLRGGTYQEGYIEIPLSKDGTAENYSSIQSYSGEWAIIDGQRTTSNGVVIGHKGFDNSVDIDYWKFERLEITGGGRDSVEMNCAGIWAGGKGIMIRYNYIHDNLSYTADENPGGLVGVMLEDATIEYNMFENNGSVIDTAHNAAHVVSFSDYSQLTSTRNEYTATNGFDGLYGTQNNTYRYNYFKDGVVGIKHKGTQLLSGRNEAGGHGWDDTYIDKGDKIHHNIFSNNSGESIYVDQDFCQVYQNIIDSPGSPNICVQYAYRTNLYKTSVYNNTLTSTTGRGIIHYGTRKWAFEELKHFSLDINNIIVGGQSGSPLGYQDILTVMPYQSTANPDEFDLTKYYGSYNLFYNPVTTASQIRMYNTSYNETTFEAQTKTHTPKETYVNLSSTGLFEGVTGSGQYKTVGTYIVEDTTTIENGGFGTAHPFLSGVAIPSFVGATNPSDNDWVAGVLDLNVAYLTDATGDPTWIEAGSTAPTVTLQSDFATAEDPTSYTGSFNVSAGRTAATIVSSNGFTVTCDDGDCTDEETEAFTVTGVTPIPVSDTIAVTDSSAGTGNATINITGTSEPVEGAYNNISIGDGIAVNGGINIGKGAIRIGSPVSTELTCTALLLEDGGSLLLEDGTSALLLE